jgi:hypothetical protein
VSELGNKLVTSDVTSDYRAPRDPRTGQLLPGARLNPLGRPKADEVRKLLEEASPGAANRLITLSNSTDEAIALRATDSILDRHLGRPSVAITGADGGAIRHEHGMSEAAERIAEEIARALLGEGDE